MSKLLNVQNKCINCIKGKKLHVSTKGSQWEILAYIWLDTEIHADHADGLLTHYAAYASIEAHCKQVDLLTSASLVSIDKLQQCMQIN